MSSLNLGISTWPFLKGVTIATMEPLNIIFPPCYEFGATFKPNIRNHARFDIKSHFQHFSAGRADVHARGTSITHAGVGLQIRDNSDRHASRPASFCFILYAALVRTRGDQALIDLFPKIEDR